MNWKAISTAQRNSIRNSPARRMINLSLSDTTLTITAADCDLSPAHRSQLAFWGFRRESGSKSYCVTSPDASLLVVKLVKYFERLGLSVSYDSYLKRLLDQHHESH